MNYVVYWQSDERNERDGPLAVYDTKAWAKFDARTRIEERAHQLNDEAIKQCKRSIKESLAKNPLEFSIHYELGPAEGEWLGFGLKMKRYPNGEWAVKEQTRLDGLVKRAKEDPFFNISEDGTGWRIIDEGVYVKELP